MRRIAFAASLLGLVGCIVPPSSSQRLTEAALDMNTATRFGRMDVALERVGAQARPEFVTRHAAWGTRLKVVDVEFGGFDMKKGDEAEVYLEVLWLLPDDTTVRSTRLAQRWVDQRGHWELVGEERKEGDSGLLGEPPPAQKPSESSGAAAFRPARIGLQTRVIRGD
jgi:hypothetical protein